MLFHYLTRLSFLHHISTAFPHRLYTLTPLPRTQLPRTQLPRTQLPRTRT
jgi:hypothetical protein